ncbi:hypothetical protein Ancab_034837 [Ancistrocladus abbreviatus]
MMREYPKKRRICNASSTPPPPLSPPTPPSNPQKERGNVHESEDGSNSGSVTESGSIYVTLPDHVLDCPICFEPLISPVVQCENGHLACSSCCIKVRYRCAQCRKKIGHIRCRAIEEVIESAKVTCCYVGHGCRAVVSYCKKRDHEEMCMYAPCSCPFHDCIFRGSSERLSQHLNQDHAKSVVRFHCNSLFPVSVVPNDKFVVLQEEEEGVFFILIAKELISLKCVEANPEKGRFAYDLIVSSTGNSIRFQSSTESFTETTVGQVDVPPPLDSLLAPRGGFSNISETLKLELCIWGKDASRPNISEAISPSSGTSSMLGDYW